MQIQGLVFGQYIWRRGMTERRRSTMNAIFHGAIIALSFGIYLYPTTVLAETSLFQQGLRDCLAAVVSRDSSRLGRNAVVEGTIESGIVARYPRGLDGRSYAVQLREQPQGTPEAGVWIYVTGHRRWAHCWQSTSRLTCRIYVFWLAARRCVS